ncbi:MAG TPA: MBOAT family O-acyltransferase [Verrucomicrobiae bacterium]|jgi:D-alanyl-lipoteichoic acid acyltransferase DltB (MBOAT superfamily)
MTFNSLAFLVFLLIVFSLYWLCERRVQNLLLLVASYVFYGWWDWRFLIMIILSSLLDFWIGLRIAGTENRFHRKCYLAITLISNLGLLGFFKYFNFFAENLARLLHGLGFQATWTTLHILLPVGISFYTFKTLSYSIDVYRGECPAHRNLLEFLAFIAFFPELVAGPIMRAATLLPQFVHSRSFDLELAKDGARQMLWGFFQKVVVADGLSAYVNTKFAAGSGAHGEELLLAGYFFAFQIYCDFAGYSNIAFGIARLFGFTLVRNFNCPYFSRNTAEFWQRWHISLSTWFRDYVYIPLGGSRVSFPRVVFNILLTFAISGLWHGASWTFVIWGVLNGLYFVPILFRRHYFGRKEAGAKDAPRLRDWPWMFLVFHLILIGWIFFRAESIGRALAIFKTMAVDFHPVAFLSGELKLKALIACLALAEWLQRRKAHPFEIRDFARPVRWFAYNAMAFVILFWGSFAYTPFIYYQF